MAKYILQPPAPHPWPSFHYNCDNDDFKNIYMFLVYFIMRDKKVVQFIFYQLERTCLSEKTKLTQLFFF